MCIIIAFLIVVTIFNHFNFVFIIKNLTRYSYESSSQRINNIKIKTYIMDFTIVFSF